MSSTFAGNKAANSVGCLNHQQRLVTAWRMYAEDNRDALPFAYALSAPNANSAWVRDRIEQMPPDYEAGVRKGALWPYWGGSIDIFRCPAARSAATVPGGRSVFVRTVSMSNWVGGNGDSPESGYKGLWNFSFPAPIYRKLSQLRHPGPARTFVFLDERPESLTDGIFITEMEGYPGRIQSRIVDYPGMYHSAAGSFGFADGHAEIHQWRDRRTTPPPSSNLQLNVPSPNNPDVFWMQSHATGLP